MPKYTLSQLLDAQRQVQFKIGHPMGDAEEAIKENVLALIVEATEVLNEINWKPWKVDVDQVDHDKLKGEIADCFLFCMNIANEASVSAEAITEEILKKQIKAVQRHRRDKDQGVLFDED